MVSATACVESGKVPTEHCKETISGLYFAGSVPSATCDVCGVVDPNNPNAVVDPNATTPGTTPETTTPGQTTTPGTATPEETPSDQGGQNTPPASQEQTPSVGPNEGGEELEGGAVTASAPPG